MVSITIKKFLKGRGLDVSKGHFLKEATHAYIEPDNFYTLKKFAKQESLDFIYSKNLINETKFHKILLKEWFFFCKRGGTIIIEMDNNGILDFDQLIKETDLLLGDKAKIIEKKKTRKGGQVVIKKIKKALKKGDSIDKWSFGIITNGSKVDALEKQIDSIIALGIPHFEIIICGPYKPVGKRKKYVRVIPFNPPIAWITKKKNLIVKNAKYENLVITHNRFMFDRGWYKGMKKYGNYFEVLSCMITTFSRRRAGDWLTYGVDISNRWLNRIGLLEYRDWDENLIINGSFYIIKKSVSQKCPWDESLIWGQREDDKISLEFHRNGIVPRFNIYSKVYTFPERYGDWHWKYKFNKKKLGKIPFELSIKYLQRQINYFLRKYTNYGIIKKPNYETYGWF